MTSPILHVLRLACMPILDQLKLEEALLRCDQRNWCLINTGSPPAVVMGISGKSEQLLDLDKLANRQIPVVRRFSGGGTVYVNQDTCFATFIGNSAETKVPCFPAEVHRLVKEIYNQVFPDLPFSLRENDYVLGERKFGGNAQYLRKDRWLHHSTLLWDFNVEEMDVLLLPPKRPAYRMNRPHEEFLCTLKSHLKSKEELFDKILESLERTFFLKESHLQEVEGVLDLPHRKATQVVNCTTKRFMDHFDF